MQKSYNRNDLFLILEVLVLNTEKKSLKLNGMQTIF